jgi:predicted transposase/invertase (TIGR01784 family)
MLTRSVIEVENAMERMEYEAREKAVRDYNQGMYEAEQRGERRGREEGQRLSRESIAKNMLSLGLSAETIFQATGVHVDQIRN